MATKTRQKYVPPIAIPPGEFLAEELAERGLTQKSLADAMRRPPQVVSEIVNGKKAITAATALQLEDVLGIPATTWLGLEADYQLVLAREKRTTRKRKAS